MAFDRLRGALVVAIAAAGTVCAVEPATAGPAGRSVVAEAPDVAAALAAAEASGRRVEALSQRTEHAQVFVTPDGNLTHEQHIVPQRVRRPDGSWVPVDTTIRAGTGGTVGPVATAVDMTFSGGGSGPLAWIARDRKTLSLALPWTLPRPELDGERALYRDVLPEVDLALTARPEGFAEVLVVRTRKAAANPALSALRFHIQTTGLSVRPDAGGFVAVDATGAPVFTSPAPVMWDSAGGAAERSAGPADGDRVSEMDTTVTAAEMLVLPNRAFLDDPARVFPVYVDPSVGAARNEWAMISSGFPDQEYHNFAGKSDEGMGLCDVQTDSLCNRDQVKRLVWEFGVPPAIHGQRVLSATFRAYETNAYDCGADWVELWRVGAISTATNWSNHAGTWARGLHGVLIARGPGCANGPGFVEFTATSGVAEAAAGRWGALALGLRAANEGSMPGGWKRFRNDATLSITYNSYPLSPVGSTVAGKPCPATGAVFVSTMTPALQAIVRDPDADETDLKGLFTWQRWDTAASAWVAVGSAEHTGRKPNDVAQVTIGVTPGSGPPLVDAGRYRWQAQTHDPWVFGSQSGTEVSGPSPWCEFEVDATPPDVAPSVSSDFYRDDGEPRGAPGRTATFTLGANGVGDVIGFKVGWRDPPTTFVPAPSGTVTARLTPPPPNPDDPTDGGPVTLFAVSVDRADQESTQQQRYSFLIGSATSPAGHWVLDEAAGASTLADSSGGGHDATVRGAIPGSPGRLVDGPTAVEFDGVDDSAATAGPVVDTTASYTIAAWVRPDVNDGWRNVASTSGTYNSAFYLRRDAGNRWTFTILERDDPAGGPGAEIYSTSVSRPGVWTHVAGVYDAADGRLRLYVNGLLEASTTIPRTFAASGALVIGAARYIGNPNWFSAWDGAIADVRVWDRVVDAGELLPLARTLVGRWALDGDGSDATVNGRDATPVGPVSWGPNRQGTPVSATVLNGVDTRLRTARPVLRTDQSYTVAAWVRPDVNGDGYRSVVSAVGINNSAFFLRRAPGNQWLFTVVESDTGGAHANLVGTTLSTPGRWTHIAGVYDAQSGQIRLYVDGAPEAATTVARTFAASGPLVIGHDRWAGSATYHAPWDGSIDEIQVYHGAMTTPEIQKLHQTSP